MEDEGYFNGKHFLPWAKLKNVKRMLIIHGGRQKRLIKHSLSMEEEGLFNKHLFSSMDDDTKNKK